jgi:hypothetical protein
MINEEQTSTLFPVATINSIINSAINRVWSSMNHDDARIYTCSAIGVRDYPLPEADTLHGTAQVSTVFYDDTEIAAAAQRVYDDLEQGTPTEFWVENKTLYFYPTPNADSHDIIISYKPEARFLASDSDVSNLDDVGVEAAILYTAYMCKAKDEETQMANYFKGMYDDLMSEVVMTTPGVYAAGAAPISYAGAK